MNDKLKAILKAKGKTVYGLSLVLGITPQGAQYIVGTKDLKKDYELLKTIAEYAECEIEDFLEDESTN